MKKAGVTASYRFAAILCLFFYMPLPKGPSNYPANINSTSRLLRIKEQAKTPAFLFI
jgi:hypothetical protein